MDERLKPIVETLAAAGVSLAKISWYGYSDEGWVGEDGVALWSADGAEVDLPSPTEKRVTTRLIDLVEMELEKHHGGWEINEGGEGYAELSVAEQTLTLYHYITVEVQEATDPVVIS
jgi:hypothetical protein